MILMAMRIVLPIMAKARTEPPKMTAKIMTASMVYQPRCVMMKWRETFREAKI